MMPAPARHRRTLRRDVLYTDATPRQRIVANTLYIGAWLMYLAGAVVVIAVAARSGWAMASVAFVGAVLLVWFWRRVVVAVVEIILS